MTGAQGGWGLPVEKGLGELFGLGTFWAVQPQKVHSWSF